MKKLGGGSRLGEGEIRGCILNLVILRCSRKVRAGRKIKRWTSGQASLKFQGGVYTGDVQGSFRSGPVHGLGSGYRRGNHKVVGICNGPEVRDGTAGGEAQGVGIPEAASRGERAFGPIAFWPLSEGGEARDKELRVKSQAGIETAL